MNADSPTTLAADSIPSPPGKRRRLSRRARRVIGIIALLIVAIAIYPLWRTVALGRADLSMQSVALPADLPLRKMDRVLILSPHLDDETLGAGGTIAHAVRLGARVRVVFFTNGDGSTSTLIAENARRLRRHSYPEIAQMRQREALAALRELGVARRDVIFLGYPDGGLQTMWQSNWQSNFRSKTTGFDRSPYANSFTPKAPYRGAQVLRDVTRIVAQFRPTRLFTTHPADTHGDHWAAYAFTRAALESLHARGDKIGRANLSAFLVHHGVWPLPHGYRPDARLTPPAAQRYQNTRWRERRLSPTERAQKTRALDRYASQLVWTPLYLRAFLRRNEPFGSISERQITLKRAQSTAVLRDEVNDDIRQMRRSGADIRAVSVIAAPNGLRFQIQLGAPPRSDATYTLNLHEVDDKGVVTTRNIIARGVSKPKLEIVAPWPSAAKHPRAVLVSLSVRIGNSLLDQSETATLRLR